MIDLNQIFFSAVRDRIVMEILIRGADLDLLDDSIEKAGSRFIFINSRRKDKFIVSPWNVDQVTIFLILLNSEVFKKSPKVAEMLYYYLRTRFCVEIFPSRKIPELFTLVHPLGTILGNAQYGEGMVFYQRVTIGGDSKLRYPVIGNNVILYSNSSVIGKSVVGDNSIIGAGVHIIEEEIPDNVVVYMDAGVRKIKVNLYKNMEKFFK